MTMRRFLLCALAFPLLFACSTNQSDDTGGGGQGPGPKPEPTGECVDRMLIKSEGHTIGSREVTRDVASGLVLKRVIMGHGEETVETFTYNPQKLVSEVLRKHTEDNESDTMKWVHLYNDSGQLIDTKEYALQSDGTWKLLICQGHKYDAAGRRAEFTTLAYCDPEASATVSYKYDAQGRVTEVGPGTSFFSYGEGGLLEEKLFADGALTWQVNYSHEGNLTSREVTQLDKDKSTVSRRTQKVDSSTTVAGCDPFDPMPERGDCAKECDGLYQEDLPALGKNDIAVACSNTLEEKVFPLQGNTDEAEVVRTWSYQDGQRVMVETLVSPGPPLPDIVTTRTTKLDGKGRPLEQTSISKTQAGEEKQVHTYSYEDGCGSK